MLLTQDFCGWCSNVFVKMSEKIRAPKSFFFRPRWMTEVLEWKKDSYALESLESGKRPPYLRAKFCSCRSCSDVLASRLAESMLRVVVASRSNELWQMVVSEKATWKTVMERDGKAAVQLSEGPSDAEKASILNLLSPPKKRRQTEKCADDWKSHRAQTSHDWTRRRTVIDSEFRFSEARYTQFKIGARGEICSILGRYTKKTKNLRFYVGLTGIESPQGPSNLHIFKKIKRLDSEKSPNLPILNQKKITYASQSHIECEIFDVFVFLSICRFCTLFASKCCCFLFWVYACFVHSSQE